MREGCNKQKQLSTCFVQMHGPRILAFSDEIQVLGFVKATAVRDVFKEVH